MSELKRFRPGLARFQFTPFDFDQASRVLLSSFKQQRRPASPLPLYSEWTDPPRHRVAFAAPASGRPRAIER